MTGGDRRIGGWRSALASITVGLLTTAGVAYLLGQWREIDRPAERLTARGSLAWSRNQPRIRRAGRGSRGGLPGLGRPYRAFRIPKAGAFLAVDPADYAGQWLDYRVELGVNEFGEVTRVELFSSAPRIVA